MGKIELILGPMFAGKSSELLRRIRRYQFGNNKCLLIKPDIDTRYSMDSIATHDKIALQAISMTRLMGKDNIARIADYDVIGIDEGQFFGDLKEFSEYAANLGKIVIISALDGDFNRKPFGEICEMVPLCESVEKLTAICMICKEKEASFSKRICTGNQRDLIGGSESYLASCRHCYHLE